MQSINVRDDGLTVIAGAGVGHDPAAEPVAFTVMFADVEPSETVTVAPETADDGFARRMLTTLPLTVAVIPLLLEAALNTPEPPEIVA